MRKNKKKKRGWAGKLDENIAQSKKLKLNRKLKTQPGTKVKEIGTEAESTVKTAGTKNNEREPEIEIEDGIQTRSKTLELRE